MFKIRYANTYITVTIATFSNKVQVYVKLLFPGNQSKIRLLIWDY